MKATTIFIPALLFHHRKQLNVGFFVLLNLLEKKDFTPQRFHFYEQKKKPEDINGHSFVENNARAYEKFCTCTTPLVPQLKKVARAWLCSLLLLSKNRSKNE